jgi:hypothetical protein
MPPLTPNKMRFGSLIMNRVKKMHYGKDAQILLCLTSGLNRFLLSRRIAHGN